jgi:hypothetical protein
VVAVAASSSSTSISTVRFWASISSTKGAMRTTRPRSGFPGCESTVTRAGCPGLMRAESTSSMGALT